MLAIKEVSIHVGSRTSPGLLLDRVSATYPLAHFGAIIGPSGCGKTSLLKLIAGIAPGDETGEVCWQGRNLADEDFHGSEIAYVPQFGIGHEELTARECVRFALDLRVRKTPQEDHQQSVDRLIASLGMREFENQFVKTLSGGQRRRMALAMELTSEPAILLCDEVTSGLDPRSANDIVCLLQSQSRGAGRLVLSVTHNLEHLDSYDSVLVLVAGVVAYHGPPALLPGYFGVENPAHLYSCLNSRSAAEWRVLWQSHSDKVKPDAQFGIPVPVGPLSSRRVPVLISQFSTLLHRRILIFVRSRSQLLLQLSFIAGFPLLVSLFAWNGLPQVENLSLGLNSNTLDQVIESRQFLIHSSKLGSLVSGIVMFQVILLTLMGANNSGQEIAGERQIFEMERLSGLNPLAYVGSKAAFLFGLVFAQSVWMGVFVHGVCEFPGNFPAQLGCLLLVNAAVTAVCLGISSLMRSPEQASLASIYLVGFQLPLSGAVLALPEPIGTLVRPMISAYWGWAGMLQTLKLERCYDIVQSVIQSPLASPAVCVWVLLTQTLAGLAVAWIGCERRQSA